MRGGGEVDGGELVGEGEEGGSYSRGNEEFDDFFIFKFGVLIL